MLGQADSAIAFGKVGPTESESYIASVRVVRLPRALTSTDFVELIRANHRSNTDPTRFKHLRSEERVPEAGDTTEVWAHVLAEDHGPGGTAQGDDTMLLEIYSRDRRIPADNAVLVMAQYSWRHFAPSVDRELAAKAKTFLAGVMDHRGGLR